MKSSINRSQGWLSTISPQSSFLLRLVLLLGLILLVGCPDPPSKKNKNKDKTITDLQIETDQGIGPNFVTVQHCLIMFKNKMSKQHVTRTQAEAKKIAYELLEKAKSGADFAAIIKEHTDDAAPGIYRMANFGLQGATSPIADPIDQVFERGEMAKSFGDVGFALEVGEFGMADFDKKDCPFGYHIIKRIK